MNSCKSNTTAKLLFFVALLSLLNLARATDEASLFLAQASTSGGNYRVSRDGNGIEISSAADATIPKICRLTQNVSRARITNDGQALLVNENGFVELESLTSCGERVVHVKTAPKSSGLLEDVNVRQSLYLSLVPVTSAPASYLAIVGKLGSSKNIASFPGAFIDGASVEKQRRQAFSYSEDVGPFAAISPDGRYVAPSGIIDCSRDAYPGVWDVKTNTKINFNGSTVEQSTLCNQLFLSSGKN